MKTKAQIESAFEAITGVCIAATEHPEEFADISEDRKQDIASVALALAWVLEIESFPGRAALDKSLASITSTIDRYPEFARWLSAVSKKDQK